MVSIELRPGFQAGLCLIAHGPEIECFGPTIGLNKVINWAKRRKLGLHLNSIPFYYLGPNCLALSDVPCRMTCYFNDFRPEPHVKSLGPNSKFLTNRIALFRFQIGPRPSCKPGPHSHIGGKRSPKFLSLL